MSKPGTLRSSSLPSVLLLQWLTDFFILLCSRYNHHSVIPKSEWHLPEISVLLSTGFDCDNFESFRKSLMNWDLETQRSSTLLFPPSVAKYVFYTPPLMCQIQCCMMGNLFLKKSYFSVSMCELCTTVTPPWYWTTAVPVSFMGGNCLRVRGRRADLELLGLVNPSAHSCTRLKNNLITSTHLSWLFLSLERKRRLSGGSSLEGREQSLLGVLCLIRLLIHSLAQAQSSSYTTATGLILA